MIEGSGGMEQNNKSTRRNFLAGVLAFTGIPAIARGKEKDLKQLVFEIGSMMLEKRDENFFEFDDMADAGIPGKETASSKFANFKVKGLEDVEGFRDEIKEEDIGDLIVLLGTKFPLKSIEDMAYTLYVDADLEEGAGPFFAVHINIDGTEINSLTEDGSTWNTEESIIEGLTFMFKKLAVIKDRAKARAIKVAKEREESENK
jgi:hypothetical protein